MIGNVRKRTSDLRPQRLKPAYASAQSDRSLRCQHKETLHPWLSKMRPVKIQIRLCNCTVWSESSLGPHVRRYVFWHCGSDNAFHLFVSHESCFEKLFAVEEVVCSMSHNDKKRMFEHMCPANTFQKCCQSDMMLHFIEFFYHYYYYFTLWKENGGKSLYDS